MKNFIVKHKKALLLLFSTWGLFFLRIWLKIIQFRPDGLYIGHSNAWGDWALHIGIASIFANRSPENWFTSHPIYSGAKFSYAFVTDMISGLMMKIGIPLTTSFIIPSIIITIFLLAGLYFFFSRIFKNKILIILAISLFFLSSGLGFTNYLKDIFSNHTAQSVFAPSIEYSESDNEWYSGNVLVGLLIPQRTFLLGMTVTIWIINILFLSFDLFDNNKTKRNTKEEKKKPSTFLLSVSGVFAGLLPIIHMHSFLVLIALSSFIFIFKYKEWKRWLYYIIPAGIISSILYFLFVHGSIERTDFMRWSIGWTAKSVLDWLRMWAFNWGFMIPVAAIGTYFLFKEGNKGVGIFILSFWLIFIISNLIIFQPTNWDNTKFFTWVYLGFTIPAVFLIKKLWNKFKILSILLIFVLSFTGFLELLKLQQDLNRPFKLADTEDLTLAEEVGNSIEDNAVLLTSNIHNHPIFLVSGRQIVLGYPGWAYTYGFLYQERDMDIRRMYQNPKYYRDLFKKYNVNYVVIGPSEINSFEQVDQSFFDNNLLVVFENRTYKIYDSSKFSE